MPESINNTFGSLAVMTADDWISRFVARMTERGSWMTAEDARCVAESVDDGGDPMHWEAPEAMADERLLADGDVSDRGVSLATPFASGRVWFLANGLGRVVGGPFAGREAARQYVRA